MFGRNHINSVVASLEEVCRRFISYQNDNISTDEHISNDMFFVRVEARTHDLFFQKKHLTITERS
jgi:hypothetical protein